MSEYTDKIMKIFLNNKEHGTEGAKMVEIEIFSARNTTGIAINNMRVTKTKPYGFIQPMQKYVVDEKAIIEAIGADVQPIVYAHKTINVGRRSYCSNCGKLAIMEDFCSKCGAKVKDGEPTRNLTDGETAIYESQIEREAKDTGVNIMVGDTD